MKNTRRFFDAGTAAAVLMVVAAAYLFLTPAYLFPDGQGYCAYLPSLFFDGDLHFYNDFTAMRIPVPLALTSTGHISNNWPFGAAFFWSPFYLAAKLLRGLGDHPYSGWFWLWVNFGTIVYGVAAFFLSSRLAQSEDDGDRSASPAIAALAFIGTPMFFYTFVVSSTAHAVSAFAVTLFVWYWLASYGRPDRLRRYVLLGLLLGLAAMVRPQEALFGIVVPVERLLRRRESPSLAAEAGNIALFALFFAVGVSPQLLIWKIVNGSFFAAPAKFNLSLAYFAPGEVMFSPYHGILFWTPVFLVAAAGIIRGCFRRPAVYAGLLAAVLGQLFVNACCAAFWEGYSFGLRQMTSSLPAVVLGLCEFKRSFRNAPAALCAAGWGAIVVPCLWTAGLLCNYYRGLDLLGYVPAARLFAAQAALIGQLPGVLAKIWSAPRAPFGLCITLCLFGAAFLYALSSLKRMAEATTVRAVGVLLVAVLLFNGLIIKAKYAAPAAPAPDAALVSPAELDRFFIGQVEDIKRKYRLAKASGSGEVPR